MSTSFYILFPTSTRAAKNSAAMRMKTISFQSYPQRAMIRTVSRIASTA